MDRYTDTSDEECYDCATETSIRVMELEKEKAEEEKDNGGKEEVTEEAKELKE